MRFARGSRSLSRDRLLASSPIPLVIAHRGRSGVEPENTLLALGRSIQRGFLTLETDVRLGVGGETVLAHDIFDMWWMGQYEGPAECSERATLEDAVAMLDNSSSLLVVEMKTGGLERRVAETLVAWGGRCVVTSFAHEQLQEFREIEPSIPTGLLFGFDRVVTAVLGLLPGEALVEELRDSGADIAMPTHHLLTSHAVTRVREAGYPVWTWTVNRPRLAHRIAVGRLADAIITDRPSTIARVLDRIALASNTM